MLRILVSTLLGAVVLFFWGFLSWAVIGLHSASVQPLANEDAVLSALMEQVPEDGMYFFPGMPSDPDLSATEQDAATATATAKYAEGPIGVLMFHREGRDPEDPMVFAQGFLNCLACSLIATLLLVAALPRLHSYISKVAFVTAIGLIVWLAGDRTYEIWLAFDAVHTRTMLMDHLVGWGAFGLVAGAVIKGGPKT